MNNEIREIITQLKAPFPIESHKERELPGKGRWFFIPWQTIRDRLDEVCPEWQVSYSEPNYLGDYCHITCTIIIANISRSAPGNAKIEQLSSSGKDMSRGTPIERAIADAFKNAAEAWGVARYLDDQTFVVKYMQSKGDMRGYKFFTENNQLEAGARGTPKPKSSRLQASRTLNSLEDKQIDRNLVNLEIDSIRERKNIPLETAKTLLAERFNVRSRSELSDEQLVELLECLRMKPSQKEVQNAKG